ncbi:hypothetical protein A2U01_0040794 [Trifolium medium]|uniref:Uncharacterized protein n=1 Tax=Trifolium medium TaxID=97028 RepID=A0A392Q8Q8_9FABA|nr:hypothetical protein [Trifolium medium]
MAVGAAIWWRNRGLWRRRGFAGLAAAAPFVLLLLGGSVVVVVIKC